MSYDQLVHFCSFGAAFKLTVVYFDPSINTLQEMETTLNSKDIRFILFDFICILETKTQGLAKLMTIFVTNEFQAFSFFFFTYNYILWCIYISNGSVFNGTQNTRIYPTILINRISKIFLMIKYLFRYSRNQLRHQTE